MLCRAAMIAPVEGGTRYGRWTWALYDRFDCVNLFERYAEATPWSAPQARERARGLLAEYDSKVVVCLGRRAAGAVVTVLAEDAGVPAVVPAYNGWFVLDGRCVVLAAHPSGLNRLLNDPAEREALGLTLREAMSYAA